jgi:hypothetical protein
MHCLADQQLVVGPDIFGIEHGGLLGECPSEDESEVQARLFADLASRFSDQ